MKKIILIIATVGISLPGIAQDKYVISALTSLKGNNLEEAKADIDKAMTSPETKEKPKALFAKAQIYFSMQQSDKYKASSPYREGTQALYKLAEVKPDYEKATVDQLLLISAYLYYNDGAKAYNDKKLADASDYMKNVIKIHDMNEGKRFEKTQFAKTFDTVSAEANQTLANSAYYLGKYDDAIPLLTAVKNNPITKTPSIYECLIDAYNRQKNSAQALATIQEARSAFPNDVTIRNYELNYYITSGKQDELVKKLEDAAAKEPDNDVLQFNIATTYLGMANPKEGKKPANTGELTAKSEEAFRHALKIAPDNAGYNYNFGALYYNQATDVNDQMNAITGTSDADQKKYDNLKTQRDAFFGKSLPYFEKAYSVLSANESSLKDEDKRTYKSTLLALKEVYARQNKMDKSADMKKKYESMK
jgi:predicted Zn-dependent protease